MYRDGTDLILGVMVEDKFQPLGHSTGCKISDSSETGERTTKEENTGKWSEKYVKKLSESISADGFVYEGDTMGFPTLKSLWLSAIPVKLRYAYRGEEEKTYYQGDYIITSLEDNGQAGDDEKYSITFENTGPVTSHPVAPDPAPAAG